MVFEAAQDQYRLGTEGRPVATSFRAEIEVKPAASQVELGRIFSAGGNIFVRYLDASTIQWGYSANTGGAWHDWKATTAAPAAGAPFVAQVEYLARSSGGRMELLINGQSPGVVDNSEGMQAYLASGQATTYGFGGEINVDADARGFVGELHRIRIGSPGSPWEFATPDPALVNLNFDGHPSGVGYVAADHEVLHGSATLRAGTTISDSQAVLDERIDGVEIASGLDPGETTLDTPFVAEMRFVATSHAKMDTLISAGGNLYVRYSASGLQ